MLLGIGGYGRTSLTKLACYILSYEFFTIDPHINYTVDDWRDDLKRLLINAGKGKPTVFYFSEIQIKFDSFIEDINNILNIGEVPGLFNAEDKGVIADSVKPQEG